ncbi:MAG: hypothetical protein ABF679_00805 [Lentilactobacillus diolivorans]|mgnify:FL=1|uniref:Uncharacterized protein n=2 Tax=Lentilactobacillus diolivorans TaxID=179838 RepID=A0A0R1S892_9LACO|nr:hypothetical protein [Lentilactobacillus diolivorans]KRL65151.1 hypothetical protein FC85_GL000512 [Lentilactobacillus diolivorans DSM 14421]GEP24394.1 hypothetical protein LDI01_19870 [Lentilactobacillus diolivorans]
MSTFLYVLSGISDLCLLVLIFAWGFDYARKDRSKIKHKRHYGLWALVSLVLTVVLMLMAGSGQ